MLYEVQAAKYRHAQEDFDRAVSKGDYTATLAALEVLQTLDDEGEN